MSDDSVPVTVRILEKEYRVACPAEEQEALRSSALYLDRRMREVRDSGKVVGMDRIAVITALNIAHEMLQQKSHRESYAHSVSSRIRSLQEKIDSALNRSKQLEI